MKKFFWVWTKGARLYGFLLLIFTINTLFALPSWYQNPLRFYNPEHFWVGIGEGRDHETALIAARAEVIQLLLIDVQEDTDLGFLSTDAESQSYYADYINRYSWAFLEQQVQIAEIMRQEELQGTFYVMVSLNKFVAFTNMENEMNGLAQSIQSDLRIVEQLKDQGQIVQALETYTDIQTAVADFYSIKMLYDNLVPESFELSGIPTGNDIENQVRDLISSIRFEVVSGNQQTTREGSILPEAIVFSASIRQSAGERTYIGNLPVRVLYGDDTLIDTGFTNNDGEYIVYALAFSEQADRGRIIIQIDPVQFPDFYARHMRNVSGVAHFSTTEAVPLHVQLSVVDSSSRELPSSQRQIYRILSNNNIIIREEAPLFMNGIVIIKDLKTVDGFGTSRFLADAIIDIEFGVTDTGVILGHIQGYSRGLSDDSEDDAIERAYHNISINTRDLNLLIQSAETQISSTIAAESLQNLERGKRYFNAGNFDEAAEALLQVNFGEEYIKEAIELLMKTR